MMIVFLSEDREWFGTNRLFERLMDRINANGPLPEDAEYALEAGFAQGALFLDQKPEPLRTDLISRIACAAREIVAERQRVTFPDGDNKLDTGVADSLEKLLAILDEGA